MSYQSPVYQMILNLFDLWGLTKKQRLVLLGIPEENQNDFNDYQLGLPISDSLCVAEHEGHILAIHQYLRILFPEQQNLAYHWIGQQNKVFNGTPAAFVALNGLCGLVEIRNYLSSVCGAIPHNLTQNHITASINWLADMSSKENGT